MWPELDQLLRDEDDTTVATPYTAAVSEYRVVIHEKPDLFSEDYSQTNGHTVHDAQHPVRYHTILNFLSLYFNIITSSTF